MVSLLVEFLIRNCEIVGEWLPSWERFQSAVMVGEFLSFTGSKWVVFVTNGQQHICGLWGGGTRAHWVFREPAAAVER